MSENQNQVPPVIQPLPTAPPPESALESRTRTWNMLCHLSALAGFVIPFGNILGPLIVWQIKKDEIPSVDSHGKVALNFQITLTVAALVGGFAAVVFSFIGIGFLFVPLVMLVWLTGLILAIIAGIKANNGEDYKYPFSLELVK
jgi:uncharacterized Tic20 family protein